MSRMITRLSSRNLTAKLPSEYLISDMSRGVKHLFEVLLVKFSAKRTWQEFRQQYV